MAWTTGSPGSTRAPTITLSSRSISASFARIRALARRGPVDRAPVLEVGDLTLDPATQTARRAGVEIPLSVRELQLLEVFMRRPGEVLSRYDLLEGACDMEYENRSNVVDRPGAAA